MAISKRESEPFISFDIPQLPIKALAQLYLFMYEEDDLSEYIVGTAKDFSFIQQNVMRAILYHTWGLKLHYHQDHLILKIKASCLPANPS